MAYIDFAQTIGSLTCSPNRIVTQYHDCVDRVRSATYVRMFELLKVIGKCLYQLKKKDCLPSSPLNIFYNIKCYPLESLMLRPCPNALKIRYCLDYLGVTYLDDVVLYSSSWSEHLVQI